VIGLILAAGAGRRLRPLTDHLPKAMLPVDGDITILDRTLANLAAVGLTDVTVVVGHAADVLELHRPVLESEFGVHLNLVHNDRAQEWNNAYSLWLARERFTDGALLVNGDTVYPVGVPKTLLAERGPELLLAVDDAKRLGAEEMKVVVDDAGLVQELTKKLAPADAFGEYIGLTLIEPEAANDLADALADTWQRDPDLYYEDGFAEYARRGGEVRVSTIGAVDWVEVDNAADLARAREIACRS
jgi:choline kinase